MERIIRPFNRYGEDENLLMSDAAVDSGTILATADTLRNRRRAHGLYVASTVLSSIIVLFAFVTPSVSTPAAAQGLTPQVTDGRMVRQEERLEALITAFATMNAENKVQHERITRLEGVVAGDENIIKFGGSFVVVLTGLGAFFSRKKT